MVRGPRELLCGHPSVAPLHVSWKLAHGFGSRNESLESFASIFSPKQALSVGSQYHENVSLLIYNENQNCPGDPTLTSLSRLYL